jgi:hypothetical protein
MIIDLILKWTVPTILGGAMGLITYMLKRNNAIKNSMVLILRSQIVGKCETYLELGYLPSYARSCISDLFEEYEKLGGNHGVKSLVDNCFELPPSQ